MTTFTKPYYELQHQILEDIRTYKEDNNYIYSYFVDDVISFTIFKHSAFPRNTFRRENKLPQWCIDERVEIDRVIDNMIKAGILRYSSTGKMMKVLNLDSSYPFLLDEEDEIFH